MIRPAISIKGKIHLATIKEYPELEDVEITPTLEDQIVKSDMYGIDEVKVKGVQAYIDEDIKPEYIKEGVDILGVVGNYKGVDSSDATATSEDILMGKTAYVNNEKIEGVIPNNGELQFTPSDEEQTIPSGFTTGGSIKAVDITTLEDYDRCLTLTNSVIYGTEIHTPIEYVHSNGRNNQYVDTGIINTSKISYEIKYMQNGHINHFDTLIGAADNGGSFLMCTCDNSTSKKSLYYGTTENKVTPNYSYYNVETIVTLQGNVYTFKSGTREQSFVVGQEIEFTTHSTLWLYGLNSNGTLYGPCAARIYYCKIWDDGVLVRDLIPILDENNVACLWDKVSRTCFYAKNGTLTGGGKI